jgi:Na+/H+ antiporter NhaD/arsenite permease-like protein
MLTGILISLILLTFTLMARGILKQEVAMPLLALAAIILAGQHDGFEALQEGAREFSRIALLFTAVAVPAHILQRSQLLDWLGMRIGELIGDIWARTKISIIILVPIFGLTMVYMMAALFHNTTSILVGSVILFVICKSYGLVGLPVLAGALVASNLGGFSTRWGDTPNIVEASQWGLTHYDFATEIMPINISSLMILITAVSAWLWYSMKKRALKTGTAFETAYAKVRFRSARRTMSLDRRLVIIGLSGLIIAIIGPLFFPEFELALSALAIIVSVLADYSDHRTDTLLALGLETYATLASIFVLAQVLAYSSIGIGAALQQWLTQSGMSVWAIASASYIGTLLTEAASWASAASPIVHSQAPTHVAAWALGSGIFAGSSSLVTAASAGIILAQETKSFPEDARINFGSYLLFGLIFSLLMLLYYITILTLLY